MPEDNPYEYTCVHILCSSQDVGNPFVYPFWYINSYVIQVKNVFQRFRQRPGEVPCYNFSQGLPLLNWSCRAPFNSIVALFIPRSKWTASQSCMSGSFLSEYSFRPARKEVENE